MIWLPPEQQTALLRHVASIPDEEVCGILLGSVENELACVTDVQPVPNIAEQRRSTYRLDDAHLARALMRAEHTGPAVVGFYHSHPRTAPRPSVEDAQQAAYPGMAYVIVGPHGAGLAITAWHLGPGLAEPIAIAFEDVRPVLAPARHLPIALVMAVSLAAGLLVVMVALALLPPAPVITP